MGSATQWAVVADTTMTSEHLILALAEQAEPEVVAASVAHTIDFDGARALALNALGWSSLPPLTPLAPGRNHGSARRLAAEAVPALLPPLGSRSGFAVTAVAHRHRRYDFVRRHLSWVAGWACWFGNRRAGLRDRWFRLTWRY
jgi:hypothetical protein